MKSLLLPAIAVCALPALAGTPVNLWRAAEPVELTEPLMLDNFDAKGNRFQSTSMLKGMRVDPARATSALTADTLRMSDAGERNVVYDFFTRLRSPRFAKGALDVAANTPFVLYIDGKEAATYSPAMQGGKADLTLNPEQTYSICLRVLDETGSASDPQVSMTWEPATGFDTISPLIEPQGKRRFLLDDTMFGPRVASASLSADGRWLLTNYSNMTDVDNTLRHSTLTDLRTGKKQTIASQPSMAWMPTSSRLYYTQKGEDGYDLVVLDPATMATSILVTNVPDEPLIFNRTEDRLYYVKSESADEPTGPVKRVTSPAERIPGGNMRSNLHEIDPTTGLDRALTFGHEALDIIDLHPDGVRLLLMSVKETPTKRPFTEYGIYEFNTRTLAIDTIIAPTSMVAGATYSPDGSQLLVVGAPDLFDGIGANYGNHKEGNEYDRQLYLLDLNSRSAKALSRDFTPSIEDTPVWSHYDGKLYFRATNGFNLPLYSYDFKTGTYTSLPLPEGFTTARSMNMPDGASRLVFTGQGPELNGGLYTYDIKSRKTTEIDNPLASRLNEIEMAQGEPWQFTASDGTTIDGFIFLPPGFEASKKYPLIVYYYGGTLPTQHNISSPYSPQVFASRDYVVYALNPSGTTGYGQEFSARHANAWGKRTAEDIIEGTEQFIKAHPFVDAEKVGCIGASYGGFMTQYLQTLTPMFAAAVSHAGISDVTSYWGEGYWGYSYNAVAAPDSYPWSNPELFTRQGSLFNADKIHTPLLLLHGTADTNVPVGESIQLYNALRILDRPVELVTVDGENHFISDYAKRRIWQDTIMSWFARYLQDDPSWWEALYPDSIEK